MTFFALFSLVDLIIFSVIFFAMFGSVWADERDSNGSLKWMTFIVSIVVVATIYWSSWTASSVFDYLSSFEFIKSVMFYTTAGVVYAVSKFVIKTRSVANEASRMWNEYTNKRKSVDKALSDGSVSIRNVAIGEGNLYTIKYSLNDLCPFFNFTTESSDTKLLQYPRVTTNKSELVSYLSVWIIFWPLYLLVNILGDFISAITTTISRIIVRWSMNLVEHIFKSSFERNK